MFIDDRMKARLVVAAIEMAVARRGEVAGCILHADRGSQFRARKVQRDLIRHRMVGSMGQAGSAGDSTPHRPPWPPDPTCHPITRQSLPQPGSEAAIYRHLWDSPNAELVALWVPEDDPLDAVPFAPARLAVDGSVDN